MVTNTKDIETNYISTKLTNQEGPLYGNIKLVYIKRNRSTNDSSLGISSYNNSSSVEMAPHELEMKPNSNRKQSHDFHSFNMSAIAKNPFDQGIQNTRVRLNVGGQIFETNKMTLKLFADSRLANLSEANSNYDSMKRVR